MLTATALVLFYDHPGIVLVLCGHGAQQERPFRFDAVLCHHRAHDDIVGLVWLQYRIRGGEGAYWGGLDKVFLKGIGVDTLSVIGLRVSEDDEIEGLDLSQHDERGYIL